MFAVGVQSGRMNEQCSGLLFMICAPAVVVLDLEEFDGHMQCILEFHLNCCVFCATLDIFISALR